MGRLWGFLRSVGVGNEEYFSNSRGKGFKSRNTRRDKDVNAMGCDAGKTLGIERKSEKYKLGCVISALRGHNHVSLAILKRKRASSHERTQKINKKRDLIR